MKGLARVLDWAENPTEVARRGKQISYPLNIAKGLIPLQMKDPHVLPSMPPNVFAIATSLSPSQFALQVLPSLKALFAVKEPPQNTVTVLDSLELLQGKCDKPVYVLLLVYNAPASDNAVASTRRLEDLA